MNSLYHVSQKKGCVSIHPKVEMVFNFYPAKTKQAYYSFQVGGLLETRTSEIVNVYKVTHMKNLI